MSLSVFVLKSPKDFAAMSLILQNGKEPKKVQSNDEHEDEDNNLSVALLLFTHAHIHTSN
jgi:hypothetical protein